ncbi:MAG TPA: ABC transporter permease [Candidatus Marinimicrobia bacterium]|jgi:sodium transport system permease protein|nr:ABC transporter permease [Candidatus Neomarinimicrobiota bacterium]
MKKIGIIFRKELKDTLRDRRTLFFMIVFPILIIPLIIGGIPKIMVSMMEKKMTERITIAIIGEENSPELMDMFGMADSINVTFNVEIDSIEQSIRKKDIDGALIIPDRFSEMVNSMETAQITMVYISSDDLEATKKRMESVINKYRESKIDQRLDRLKLHSKTLEPVKINHRNIASEKEMIGKLAGGWLPYMFILYCFMGAMYPALDLGAGEKERGTIETLLTSPAGRMEILLGKLGVISLSGFLSAISGIIGLFVGLQFMTELPIEIITTMKSIIEIKTIALILSLIVPVSIFFSAVLLSISFYAKSFKEAQSLVTPINILILFPALIGLIPGVELTWKTALIPIVNISLVTKEIIAETVSSALLLEVYGSMIILAVVGLFFTRWWFNREEVIFRG